MTTCPHCGGALTPVAAGPENAPWLCVTCRRGWWQAELTVIARKAWLPAYREFHRLSGVREDVAAEVVLARQRGTSLIEKHIPLLPASTLTAVSARFRVTEELRTAIATHLQGAP